MPAIADALWFGHDGNRGEALGWGEALGAATRHLGAYQGHGNVAHPHGILVTWAVVMEGGVQLNARGERFWDESQGYSEAARAVLAQPGGVAWTVFDERIAGGRPPVRGLPPGRGGGRRPARRDAGGPGRGGGPAAGRAGPHARGPRRTGPVRTRLRRSDARAALPGRAGDGGRCSTPRAGSRWTPRRASAAPRAACSRTCWPRAGRPAGVSGSNDGGYLSGNGLLAAVVLGRIVGFGAPAA